MRNTILLAMSLFAAVGAVAMEKGKGLALTSLPASVQKTVQQNLKGGEIRNIGKEKENGIEQYEVETVLNGQERDFDVDSNGKLLVVEEATTIDAVPAAARAGIMKKVADGKLGTVETFLKTGQPMMYEAEYSDTKGKKHEVLVKADGAETKE
jgi:hypothetical protein